LGDREKDKVIERKIHIKEREREAGRDLSCLYCLLLLQYRAKALKYIFCVGEKKNEQTGKKKERFEGRVSLHNTQWC
jgi:hypothetical protein